MPESHTTLPAEPRETARLEAFSDGVIAIAITLLIIEVAVPHAADGGSLATALLRGWPSYLAYVISFTTILIMWLNHHTLFKIIRRVDRRYLFGPTLYFVAFVAAFFSAWLSLAIDAGLAIFFLFPGVLQWMRPRR